MPVKMRIKVKNWKLAVLAFLLMAVFTSLGFWQLARAQHKKMLLNSFTERTRLDPLKTEALNEDNDWRFYRVKLTGQFDNQHNLLLDNKIFHGRVGYEVYTPFYAQDLAAPILVDRGFVPLGISRDVLPGINAIIGKVTISGMLNQAPGYLAFGQINESSNIAWPMRVEFINLNQVGKLLNYPLFQYVLNLDAKDPAAYAMEWQIVTMGPERHMGYALQWFALAFTLLILFVVLNRDRT